MKRIEVSKIPNEPITPEERGALETITKDPTKIREMEEQARQNPTIQKYMKNNESPEEKELRVAQLLKIYGLPNNDAYKQAVYINAIVNYREGPASVKSKSSKLIALKSISEIEDPEARKLGEEYMLHVDAKTALKEAKAMGQINKLPDNLKKYAKQELEKNEGPDGLPSNVLKYKIGNEYILEIANSKRVTEFIEKYNIPDNLYSRQAIWELSNKYGGNDGYQAEFAENLKKLENLPYYAKKEGYERLLSVGSFPDEITKL